MRQFHFKHKRLLMASAALAALAAVALFILSRPQQYLLLTNEQSGKILFMSPVAEGERFHVGFIHSVNKSPVYEYYRIENRQIYLDSLVYYTFGAGMPSELEPQQTIRYEDGAMIIEGFNRPMPRLCYFIGRVAAHTLYWRGEEIPLNTLDEPGQPVLFSLVEYSRLKAALHIMP